MQGKWFANKGQVIQTTLATLACFLGAIKAWPDMKNNEYFSYGAVLFYILCGLVASSVLLIIVRLRSSNAFLPPTPQPTTEVPSPKLLVSYTGLNGKEMLKVINSGQAAARNIQIKSIVIKEELDVFLYHDIPTLACGQHDESFFVLAKTSGGGRESIPLFFAMEKVASEALISLKINYQDEKGDMFSAEFSLKSFIDGRINFNPGPVTRITSSPTA